MHEWLTVVNAKADRPIKGPHGNELDLLNVAAAAERSIAHGRKGGGVPMFCSILGKQLWSQISNEQEDRAREKIAAWRRDRKQQEANMTNARATAELDRKAAAK